MKQIPNIEEEKEEIIEPDKVFDCFDEGCEECTVCKYLNFREWAEGCAPAGSSIERNQLGEDYLKRKHQQLQKAREEERERCIKIVEDYGKSMSRLHSEMIGTAHEDSKMMLAFDMHSRLIAVKHITEKMNHSELDQDNK